MVTAKVNLECRHCGRNFERRKEFRTRREANSYEAWALEHIDACPTCYAKLCKEKALAELHAALDEHGIELPKIEGVSDEQIARAESKRESYLVEHVRDIVLYARFVAIRSNPEIYDAYRRTCEERGFDPEQQINAYLVGYGLNRIWFLFTRTSASEILNGPDSTDKFWTLGKGPRATISPIIFMSKYSKGTSGDCHV